MPRYVLDIAYRGTTYSGWQTQQNTPNTIQEQLEKVLQRILKKPVACTGAGRTDAGVHALQMPAHFDWAKPLHPSFLKAMNSLLPKSIAIHAVYQCQKDNFHARFDAISRRYRYKISYQKSAFGPDLFFYPHYPLDVGLMQAGAKALMEYDSFESFCKSNANNKTYLCKLMQSHWYWEGDTLVYEVRADRFLRGMVRALVGTMILLGKNKITLDEFRKIIEQKDRKAAGFSVAASGLYLMEVIYPEHSLTRLDFPIEKYLYETKSTYSSEVEQSNE